MVAAAPVLLLAAIDIFQLRGRLRGNAVRQHQRGAAGRINLLSVVTLNDLYVKARAQSGGGLTHQRHLQIHAKGHIAGLKDGDMLGCALHLAKETLCQARGADDQRYAAALGKAKLVGQRGGHGKIDNGVEGLLHILVAFINGTIESSADPSIDACCCGKFAGILYGVVDGVTHLAADSVDENPDHECSFQINS